jgi:hypothetical protein
VFRPKRVQVLALLPRRDYEVRLRSERRVVAEAPANLAWCAVVSVGWCVGWLVCVGWCVGVLHQLHAGCGLVCSIATSISTPPPRSTHCRPVHRMSPLRCHPLTRSTAQVGVCASSSGWSRRNSRQEESKPCSSTTGGAPPPLIAPSCAWLTTVADTHSGGISERVLALGGRLKCHHPHAPSVPAAARWAPQTPSPAAAAAATGCSRRAAARAPPCRVLPAPESQTAVTAGRLAVWWCCCWWWWLQHVAPAGVGVAAGSARAQSWCHPGSAELRCSTRSPACCAAELTWCARPLLLLLLLVKGERHCSSPL